MEQPRERTESEIRREIAVRRAEVEELRRRNQLYEENKHKLDGSIVGEIVA